MLQLLTALFFRGLNEMIACIVTQDRAEDLLACRDIPATVDICAKFGDPLISALAPVISTISTEKMCPTRQLETYTMLSGIDRLDMVFSVSM